MKNLSMHVREAKTIGDRMRIAREVAGINKTQMAMLLGYSASEITRLESDDDEEGVGSYAEICAVSLMWLLTGVTGDASHLCGITDDARTLAEITG